MTSFGAKIYTAFIKNPAKKRLVYRMLMDGAFVSEIMEQGDRLKKILHYVHNYLGKSKLVIVSIFGGLGNQMYHYAFGRALQNRGYDVVFDAHYCPKANAQAENVVSNGGGGDDSFLNPTDIRNLEITHFNLTLPIDLDFDEELFFDLVDKDRAKLPPNERKPYKYLMATAPYKTIPLNFIHPNSYFGGSWFSLEYFKDIEPIIRTEFSLKTQLIPANATLKKRILATQDSVFLHIRRGDYLKHTDFYLNLKGEYYGGAINYLKTKLAKPHIFIFSNDILWCEREFLATLSDECKEGVEFEFVKNNGEDSAAHEMELMRSCKHAIIANSTFSWWASYLIDNPHKIVILPNSYGKDFPKISYDDKIQVYEGVVLVDALTGELV